MDYEQQLGAIGAAANQEIAGLNEQVNQAALVNQELNDEVLGLRETNRISVEVIESQRQQIVDLIQALADCTNSEPIKTTVFGVSAPQNTTGGKALVTPGERIFFSPGKRYSSVGNSGQLYDALNRLAPGGTLWHSFKDRAGQWTRDLYTDIHTRWPDVRILATAFHEPKDNFDYLNATSWAQWVSLQQSFEDAVGDLDFVEMVTITEAWNNPTRAPGYWDAMLRERQAFGFDSYNRGIGAPKAYIDPEVLHKPILDYTNAKKPGQRLLVGETGSGAIDTIDGYSGRTQWLLDNRAYMAEHADVAMWWNSGTDGPTGQGCRLSLNDLILWLGSD